MDIPGRACACKQHASATAQVAKTAIELYQQTSPSEDHKTSKVVELKISLATDQAYVLEHDLRPLLGRRVKHTLRKLDSQRHTQHACKTHNF